LGIVFYDKVPSPSPSKYIAYKSLDVEKAYSKALSKLVPPPDLMFLINTKASSIFSFTAATFSPFHFLPLLSKVTILKN